MAHPGLASCSCLSSFAAWIAFATAAWSEPPSERDMYATGQALFEAHVPPEFKKGIVFPSREEWDAFVARLETTRETGSLAELATYETEARATLAAVDAAPEYADYTDWLKGRLDEILLAKELPPPPAEAIAEAPATTLPDTRAIPLYDLWVERLRTHPRHARTDEFLPILKTAFAKEGIPVELAWIAETESAFNPRARSPAGARGLFQLMPATAKAQGLRLFPFDERVHPKKSARATAMLLRRLHALFGSWPLALAAYNAGEGRVRQALKARNATTFPEIADALPPETRLFVPKALATIAVREDVDPMALAAPR